jgi:hypothetical protein
MRTLRLLGYAFVATLLSCGCARFPAGGGGEQGKRIIFTITFGADVHVSQDNSYYYLILIDNDKDISGVSGPVPVIQAPWGNGYAAGHYTHMIVVGRLNPGATNQCWLYQMTDPDHDLTKFVPVGLTRVSDVAGKVIHCEISSADIGIDLSTAGAVIPLQINVIATDEIPVNPNEGSHKHWDAFGNGLEAQYTAYINIDIAQNVTHTRDDYGGVTFEPSGDVGGDPGDTKDPALDIVDFKIQVAS